LPKVRQARKTASKTKNSGDCWKTFPTKTWVATRCDFVYRCSTAANAWVTLDTFAPRGLIKYLDCQRGRKGSICSRSIAAGGGMASPNSAAFKRRRDSRV